MHAVVNGEVIQFSGVAEYIVYAEIDEIHTTQDVIERMQLIDEVELAPTYLILQRIIIEQEKINVMELVLLQ